jgi:hypothetical protein
MMKKDGISKSWRSALDQVRCSLEAMGEERNGLQRKRDSLGERLRDCINGPLSKVALIELCARMVDNKAAAYRDKFAGIVGPACMKVETYAGPTKRPLVLADVDFFMGRGHMLPEPDGGCVSEMGQSLFSWWVNPPFDTCFFFGDIVKAKLPELWDGVNLPHKDDGKTLAQREDEAAQLRGEIANLDAKLYALDADLDKLREAATMAPVAEVSPPEEESTAAFTWDQMRGLQPVHRENQENPSEHESPAR